MDVGAVMEAAQDAVSRARSGNGPTLLECQTYRFHGHFTAERALGIRYRTESEVEMWKRRDPVNSWGACLEELGYLNGAERDKLDDEVDKLLDEAVEYARSSPWPEQAEALEHMYVTRYPGLPAATSL